MFGPAAVGERATGRFVLDLPDLSDWFNPFLPRFALDAERCGGEVRVMRDGERLVGLLVSDPVERIATVFTRSRAIAEKVVRSRGSYGVYCEFWLGPGGEVYDIFGARLDPERARIRFRHPVRELRDSDIPALLDLIREVEGPVNPRWFEGLPNANEAGFEVEVDGRLAGAAWVSRAGAHARLHSLAVRVPYRRLGIASDLLHARLLWAVRNGVTEAISEIAQPNFASQQVALRGGMHRRGQVYFYRPS